MRSLRTPASVLLSTAFLACAALVGVGAPADAAQSATATVGLSSLSPQVAMPNDTLHLTGTLLSSAHAATQDDVVMRLGVETMQLQSDMAQAAGDSSRLVYNHEDQIGTLAPGRKTTWSLDVPVAALSLTVRGVYALDVEAWSDSGRIGVLRTYLPFDMTGDSSFQPTDMALLWPVTAPPALDGYSDNSAPEAVNKDLSAQFEPGGRLNELVSDATKAAAHGVTVSWVVDPNLLATASDEEHGYMLYPSDTAQTGDQNAAQWLSETESALSTTGQLWQVPATDPDIASLATIGGGLGSQTLRDAEKLSGSTVQQLTGRQPLGTLAWPADGQVDQPTLALAEQAGASAVVVSSDSVGLTTRSDTYTPTGRINLPGGTKLAVSDAALDSIFAGDPADAKYAASSNGSLLASQRFLAQSALLALELPNLSKPRTILVAPPRGVQPDAALLNAVSQASWLKTVGLSSLLGTAPDPQATAPQTKRAAATSAADLTPGQLSGYASADSALTGLAEILAQPSLATGAFTPAVLGMVSTSWRGDPAGESAFTAAVTDRLMDSVDAVSLVPKTDLTLSGKSGVIPFTVENKLETPVQVGIRITVDHAGLEVQSVQVRTLPEGSSTVNVKVKSAVSGARFTVTAQLVTPAGAAYGPTQTFQMTVSSIGSIALITVGLSAALLVIAVVLRIYRSRRTRSAQSAD